MALDKPPPEVEKLIARARALADDRNEPVTTAHLLLAMLEEKGKSTAGKFLSEGLELREGELYAALREAPEEKPRYIEHIIERAATMARRARPGSKGAARSRVNGLHLIRAIASEPDSAANRCLERLGFDTTAVGNAALGGLTGGGVKALSSASGRGGMKRKSRASGGRLGARASRTSGSAQAAPAVERLRGGDRRDAGVEESPPPRKLSPVKITKISSADLKADQKLRAKVTKLGARPSRTSRKASEPKEGATHADRRESNGAGRLRRPTGEPAATRPPELSSDGSIDWRSRLRDRLCGEAGSEAAYSPGEEDDRPLLETLARDLTEAARAGALDPLVGRHRELERMIDTLNRRKGNVPCLVGEPGVGKTALVEGLASRLVSGEVSGLGDRSILQINVGDLVAGTGVRGALAERLGRLREEVSALEGRVVLFLDEIHSLLAASGGAAGEGAQELRSAMTDGDFPCILATTADAYRRYVEQDPGFERRLTRIDVEEPSPEETVEIVATGVERYAAHHGVSYPAPVLEAATGLTHRYMTERRLPDKAFAVLDLAGARGSRRGLEVVDLDTLTEVISELTGVPADRLAATDEERLLELESRLARRIVGHEDNLRRVADALRRNAAGLGGARPVGSFLMLGPTGVGKTETARALADELFPGGGGMSRFDMSELSEPHSVARLVGAPPGYVGHEAGGQLTEAVRARPYQVVLLDEIEKAHPKVHMLLLQVLEDGRLTDGRGRMVDFTHTIVIMTSNLGVGAAARPAIGFGASETSGGQAEATLSAARAALPPELWNRFDEVLYFEGLDQAQVASVAALLLAQTGQRLVTERGLELRWDDEVVDLLLESGGYDPTLGARPMRRAIQRIVEAPLAEAVLRDGGRDARIVRLRVRAGRVEAELVH